MEKEYVGNKYHRPSDNFEPGIWDLNGIAEDARLQFFIGYNLANSDYWPGWKANSEFSNLRK